MTDKQEKMFNEMHETLIRMDEGLCKDVRNLKHDMWGNGKPGVKEDLALVKAICSECAKNKHRPSQVPAIASSICAIAALIISVIVMSQGG